MPEPDEQLLRLNRIVARALDADVKQALLEELERQPGNVAKLDPVPLAKWFRYEYARWLPNVRVCPACKAPMTTALFNYVKAYAFEADKSSWTGYRGEEVADGLRLCERVER